jgi:hypothetical protein
VEAVRGGRTPGIAGVLYGITRILKQQNKKKFDYSFFIYSNYLRAIISLSPILLSWPTLTASMAIYKVGWERGLAQGRQASSPWEGPTYTLTNSIGQAANSWGRMYLFQDYV